MKFLLFILILVVITSCKKEEPQRSFIQSAKIEDIKINEGEIPAGFLLFQEYLLKPDERGSIYIGQLWERDTIKNEMKIIEEDSVPLSESPVAFCFQTWYRSNRKEKIEFIIIICPSQKEIERTIEDYTTKMYSQPFNLTDNPLVGDQCWIPDNSTIENSSYSIMFIRANVFSRIYVHLKEQNNDDLTVTVNYIAVALDTRILAENK